MKLTTVEKCFDINQGLVELKLYTQWVQAVQEKTDTCY